MSTTSPPTELVFSYGTLQLEAVQLATFGRKLVGTADVLPGFAQSMMKIDDPDVVATRLSSDEFPDLDEDRGRGFFLLKQMVDTLRVEKSSDGLGLEFTAVRSFAGRR